MQIKVIPTIQRKSTNATQPSQKMGNPAFGKFAPPENYDQAVELADKVFVFETIKSDDPTNLSSLATSLRKKVAGTVAILENIAEKWGMTAQEVIAKY